MGWFRERMPRALAAVGVGLMVATVAGTSAATASDAGSAGTPAVWASHWESHMLARVNDARRAAGVAPVRLCMRLSAAAQGHAQQMATSGVFSHAGIDGGQYWDRIASAGYRMMTAGENIAAGQPTPRDAMIAWRASAAHYAVLTNPSFRHVGFGVAIASTGDYPVYWVQDFASGGRC